jgi:phenylacetate-CoA ligase
MFVHPSQVAEIARRHPGVGRVRLVVEGEMANDRMTLHVESSGDTPGLAEALAGSVRDITKLRADIVLAAPGSLPNDGKVIEDKRSYA